MGQLGLDYVDLYLIHFPVRDSLQTWGEFVRLRKQGLTRSIGVSNFSRRQLVELLEHSSERPAVSQIELSPFMTQVEMRRLCDEHNILVEAYSPLTRGRRLGDGRLVEIGKRYNKSAAQVILRWGIQIGVVPLAKSVHMDRIEENAGIFDFELTGDDVKRIGSMNENSSEVLSLSRRIWNRFFG